MKGPQVEGGPLSGALKKLSKEEVVAWCFHEVALTGDTQKYYSTPMRTYQSLLKQSRCAPEDLDKQANHINDNTLKLAWLYLIQLM